MSFTFESILKKVKTSTNKIILTENIIATHRSIVKNCNAVKKDSNPDPDPEPDPACDLVQKPEPRGCKIG